MTKKYYERRTVRNSNEAEMIAEEKGWDLVSLTDLEDDRGLCARFYCRPYGYSLKEEEAIARVMK